MFRKLLNPLALTSTIDVALLILRVGVSFFLMLHGYDKLQNLLAGNSADFPDPLRIGGQASHALTVFSEFFCSILLALGLCSRVALTIMICCLLIVIFSIHANEPLADREHAFLFLIPFIALFLTGPGRYSLDSLLFSKVGK